VLLSPPSPGAFPRPLCPTLGVTNLPGARPWSHSPQGRVLGASSQGTFCCGRAPAAQQTPATERAGGEAGLVAAPVLSAYILPLSLPRCQPICSALVSSRCLTSARATSLHGGLSRGHGQQAGASEPGASPVVAMFGRHRVTSASPSTYQDIQVLQLHLRQAGTSLVIWPTEKVMEEGGIIPDHKTTLLLS